MRKNTIKIPDSLYVGLSPPSKNRLPLGTITPYGTDAAALNRMDNVRRLTNARSSLLGTTIIENKPLSGFKFTCRHTGGSSHDFWYIEDPRGFEVEVSSSNLAGLLRSSTLINGEILVPCIWTRDGPNNVLISIESEEYITAINNTLAAKGKASWKDVKIGDTVLLRNNIEGQWLGRLKLVYKFRSRIQDNCLSENEYSVSDKSYHIIYSTNVKHPSPHITSVIYIIASPQLSKVLCTNPISKKESEQIVNRCLYDTSCIQVDSSYRKIVAACFNVDIKTAVFTKEHLYPKSSNELREEVGDSFRDSIPGLYVESGSKFGRLSKESRPKNNSLYNIIEYSLPHVNKSEMRRVYTETKFGRSSPMYTENRIPYNFDQKDLFYKLKMSIKTAEGNEFILYV